MLTLPRDQILVNLLTNGLRFASEGSVILMATEQNPEQCVEVCLQDTYVGIPPDDLPYIFDRFYRGGPACARTQADDGLNTSSGLGLAIVTSLVEAMWERFAAESTPGEGACIRF
jgi:signal transduction histidine kinase